MPPPAPSVFTRPLLPADDTDLVIDGGRRRLLFLAHHGKPVPLARGGAARALRRGPDLSLAIRRTGAGVSAQSAARFLRGVGSQGGAAGNQIGSGTDLEPAEKVDRRMAVLSGAGADRASDVPAANREARPADARAGDRRRSDPGGDRFGRLVLCALSGADRRPAVRRDRAGNPAPASLAAPRRRGVAAGEGRSVDL